MWWGLEELRPAIRRFLAARCRDSSELDDVVQETLLRAARYRENLADCGRLHSWVLRIASNVLRDHVRRSSRASAVQFDEDLGEALPGREPSPARGPQADWISIGDETVEREVAIAHLLRAFGELRAHDREVLRSYYAGAESCSATATECGLPPALVKVRLFRARRRLEARVRRSIALGRTRSLFVLS